MYRLCIYFFFHFVLTHTHEIVLIFVFLAWSITIRIDLNSLIQIWTYLDLLIVHELKSALISRTSYKFFGNLFWCLLLSLMF